MPSFKIRRQAFTLGGLQIGGTGNAVTTLKFGTFTFNAGSTAAASTYVGTASVTGLLSGDKIFVTPAGLSACTVFTGASVTADGTVTACVRTTGSATSACLAITMAYLALR